MNSPGPIHPGPIHPDPIHPGPIHPGPIPIQQGFCDLHPMISLLGVSLFGICYFNLKAKRGHFLRYERSKTLL